jgi:hypothetical protein
VLGYARVLDLWGVSGKFEVPSRMWWETGAA